MALYLVSECCRPTHEIFSAGGHRFARGAVGVTRGQVTGDAPTRGRARISRRDLRRKRSRPAGERSSCGTRSSDTAAESSTTGTHCDAELASLRSWGRPSHSRPQDPATCRPTSERHYDCRADPGRPGRPQGERLTGKHPRSRVADQWATTVSGPSRPISGSGITTLVLRRRPAPFIAYWAPAPPSACLRMFCS
jgi:hypothetical protein